MILELLNYHDDKKKVKFENLKYDLNDLFENPPAFNEPLLKYDNIYVNPAWNVGVYQSKNELVCILEDDFAIKDANHFQKSITRITEFNHSWDVFLLSVVINDKIKHVDEIDRILNAQTTAGYIVNGHWYFHVSNYQCFYIIDSVRQSHCASGQRICIVIGMFIAKTSVDINVFAFRWLCYV
jgi:hypothetical protein